MSYLAEIASIVEAGTTEAGSTHATWPLYGGHMPDSTVIGDRAVALLLAPGLPDDGGTGSPRSDVERPGLQVIVRGQPMNQVATAYPDAESVAFAVKNALHGFSGPSSSGGRHYVGIWADAPAFIGFDESKRPLFSTNLRVERSRSA